MQIKLPFVTKAEYEELRAEHAKLGERIAKLEKLLVKAAERVAGPTTSTELRRPVNTWRTRSSNFTKRSQTDPSTFPQTEASNVSEK